MNEEKSAIESGEADAVTTETQAETAQPAHEQGAGSPEYPDQSQDGLAKVAETLASKLPDHLKPLVPRHYTPQQQLEWISEAMEKIPASKPNIPQTDTKPAAQKAPQTDLSQLSARARLAHLYRGDA